MGRLFSVTVIADCPSPVTVGLLSTDPRGLYANVSRVGFDCVSDGVLASVIDDSGGHGRRAVVFHGRGGNTYLETDDCRESDRSAGNVDLCLAPVSDDDLRTCSNCLVANDALRTVNVAFLSRASVFECRLIDHRGRLSIVYQ